MRDDYHARARRWYDSKRWKTTRQRQLALEPYCQSPQHKGLGIQATVADHIVPHRGDSRLFWKNSNLQSLCRPCHDSWKRRHDVGGDPNRGCDANGMPLDPEHHWYQESGE